MISRYTRHLGALILGMALVSGIANAQVQAPRPVPPQQPPVAAVITSDARQVRQQLYGMLQQYPPSVRQVLQLDPSLMTNANYMGLYPGLAAFIGQHPEIAHNPTFFIGSPEYDYQGQDSFGRNLANIFEPLAVASVFIVLICVLGWIIRGIMNHRRWLRMSKLQTETQNKLFDRFGSNEEMLSFIQTSAGKRFLESASMPMEIGPRAVSAPVGRMLWSIQIGIVMLVSGGGLEVVSYRMTDADAVTGFQVAAVVVISLGVGFILSALGSYVLSRRLGLFDPASTPSS